MMNTQNAQKSNKKKLIVFTGAGVSAESGIKTFRGSNGLWEEHKIEDVATLDGWHKNKKLVLNFYNQRRKQLLAAEPNQAHYFLAELETRFDVTIITQNIDNLHERAGSKNVVHLHGELMKSRSTSDENLIFDIVGSELNLGDLCPKGSQLRPHIVWFGEAVPMMHTAVDYVIGADIFCVIGTSLAVYPAASLIHYVSSTTKIYLIDPNPPDNLNSEITVIKDIATVGVKKFVEILFNVLELKKK